MRGADLPDDLIFVAFDDYGGRIKNHRDHIGHVNDGPGEGKTLCGREQFPNAYPLADGSDPDANYFCKVCRSAAVKRGILPTPDQGGPK